MLSRRSANWANSPYSLSWQNLLVLSALRSTRRIRHTASQTLCYGNRIISRTDFLAVNWTFCCIAHTRWTSHTIPLIHNHHCNSPCCSNRFSCSCSGLECSINQKVIRAHWSWTVYLDLVLVLVPQWAVLCILVGLSWGCIWLKGWPFGGQVPFCSISKTAHWFCRVLE
jgi:hypothetical protein